jgi:DNA-binding MarR family transcriptional regulator
VAFPSGFDLSLARLNPSAVDISPQRSPTARCTLFHMGQAAVAEKTTEGSVEPTLRDYRALAELRFQIRRFLSFSEREARAAGIEPQQHQLLLAIKGLPAGGRPTIKRLAERLCVQHHTVVALVDQVAARDWARRERNDTDRREILLRLTASGERLLRRLSVLHRDQLRVVGPTLAAALSEIVGDSG